MIPKAEEAPSETSPTGERATLEGWAAVENEMLKHDEGTMKGHISDVDTLLVFAGLFSSVLTAFVVESYQRLQLDTGLGSMLVMRRISVQLESFTISPGFINSSMSAPPLPSLDFTVDMSTRWINILWFLSLVFSLVAALFGMLVKQWIREYMQWNAALAAPRDNVLLRQIRFEAWNSWHVPATIAIVPALLEISLVLFVCGLVILLWTLDPVISIVITIVVAVFLAVFSTFTILPAFFERCPYKSPTAWACTVLWDFVTLWIPHALSRRQYRLGLTLKRASNLHFIRYAGWWLMETSKYRSFRLGNWNAVSSNWRARDLARVWSSLAGGKDSKRGDATALLDELLSEQSCVRDCVQPNDTIMKKASAWADVVNTARLPLHSALRTITELPPLVRALAWVSQASQDPHVQHSVLRCAESLEERFVLARPLIKTSQGGMALTQKGVRSTSLWHLLVSFSNDRGLVSDPHGQMTSRDVPAFRARSMMNHHTGQDVSPTASYGLVHSPWLVVTETSRPATSIFIYLATLSFRSIVEELRANLHRHSDMPGALRLRSARRAMELLAVLYSFHRLDGNDSFIVRAAECLVDVLWATNGDDKELFETRFPGLRDTIWTVARYQLGTNGVLRARYEDLFGCSRTEDASLNGSLPGYSPSERLMNWSLGEREAEASQILEPSSDVAEPTQ